MTVPWYTLFVKFAAYTESPPYAGLAISTPTEVERPIGKGRRILLAVCSKNIVNWVWFVELTKNSLKQSSVFITLTMDWLLLPSRASPWKRMSAVMLSTLAGPAKPDSST
ncbi:hypothetical protein MPH_13743 [Macrophomina phaseolina MS6]|uniref:Uncharacterized protein n=1 Tax=Macrophomina phaseolina (strain MS6) TaxID=1126212 RepID=K2R8M3_MACPH|nr:hypothetical protein MPH_13743 [Macrophomina phaseolina MS6]